LRCAERRAGSGYKVHCQYCIAIATERAYARPQATSHKRVDAIHDFIRSFVSHYTENCLEPHSLYDPHNLEDTEPREMQSRLRRSPPPPPQSSVDATHSFIIHFEPSPTQPFSLLPSLDGSASPAAQLLHVYCQHSIMRPGNYTEQDADYDCDDRDRTRVSTQFTGPNRLERSV